MLQSDAISFNHAHQALHTDHRRGRGGCGALGGTRVAQDARAQALVMQVQSVGGVPSEALLEPSAIASCAQLECRQEMIKHVLESSQRVRFASTRVHGSTSKASAVAAACNFRYKVTPVTGSAQLPVEKTSNPS